MTWVKAGRTGVDSGAILITDPCYVVRARGDAPGAGHQPYQSYEQLCAAVDETFEPSYEATSQLRNEWGADIGVYVTRFGGDGVFPVYVDLDDQGRVRAAMISFDGRAPDDQ